MTEEIKIDGNSIQIGNKVCYCVDKDLLDCITNLQQAVEIKNQRIKEEQQEKERYIKFYNGLNTWNKELQQENERLNNIINELEDMIVIRLSKDYYEHNYRINTGDLEEIYDRLKELKESGNNDK